MKTERELQLEVVKAITEELLPFMEKKVSGEAIKARAEAVLSELRGKGVLYTGFDCEARVGTNGSLQFKWRKQN